MGLFLAIATAICWGGAPIIMRFSNVGTSYMPVLISLGGLSATLAFTPFRGLNASTIQWPSLLIALAAGVANGIGIVTYYRLVGGSQQGLWQLSAVSPIAYVLVPVIIAAGMLSLFHEKVNAYQLAGILLAVVAIYLLNKK